MQRIRIKIKPKQSAKALLSVLLPIIALLSACSTTPKDNEQQQVQRLWPEPPEQPRYRYITTITNSKDIEGAGNPLKKAITGSEKPGNRFKRPLAVAAFQGSLYLVDSKID